MPAYRTTYFFENVQITEGIGDSSFFGWTESWYRESADLEAALLAAVDPANYTTRRRACLPDNMRITWVRVSEANNPRNSKVAALHLRGNFPTVIVGATEATSQIPAQTNCAVLVNFTSLPVGAPPDRAVHRRFLLRGLTNGLTQGNIIRPGHAQWAPILAFLDLVGRRQTGSVAPNPIPTWLLQFQNPATPLTPVANFAIPADTPKLVTLNAPAGGAVIGQRFRIRGMKFPRGVNRIWTSRTASAAGAPMTLGASRFDLAGEWDGTGFVQPVGNLYRVASQYVIVGLRDKKTGGVFRRTRGRRSRA